MMKRTMRMIGLLLLLACLLCAVGGAAWAATYDLAVGQVYLAYDRFELPSPGTSYIYEDEPTSWSTGLAEIVNPSHSFCLQGVYKSEDQYYANIDGPKRLYIYMDPTQSGTPDGIEVMSGDGSQSNPWRFKLHYAEGFTVDFNSNGGAGQMSSVFGVSGDYVLPECRMAAPTGSAFSGWKVNNTGELLQPGATISVTQDVTIYAQWIEQTYTLEVSHGTATFNGVTASTLEGLHYGDVVTVTADEPEAGEVFDQWQTDHSGSFADRSQPTTTFTMPARDESIWVRYKDAIETCKHHDGAIVCYAWDGDALLPDTAGYYFLTEDVTIQEPWEVPQGTTALCLHNHKITMAGDGPAIKVGNGATLLLLASNQIWDQRNTVQHASGASGCGVLVDGGSYTQEIARVLNNDGGGVIVNDGSATIGYRCHIGNNGSANVLGGGVTVNGGTVTLGDGGIISENTGSKGAVCVNGGSFKTTGGQIKDNDAPVDVYVGDGDFSVGYYADPGLVYLTSGKKIGFTGYELRDGVQIPVVMEDGYGVFTSGLRRSGSEANFTSLYGDFTVELSADGEAQLAPVLLRPDLILPEGLAAIEESAFEDDAGFTVVSVPDACASIGVTAFKDCAGLTQIHLPRDCDIKDSAFTGCTSLRVIFAPAGGTTEAWAKAHGIPFAAAE